MLFKIHFHKIDIKPICQFHQIIQHIRKLLVQIVVIVRLLLALNPVSLRIACQFADFLGKQQKYFSDRILIPTLFLTCSVEVFL